jgi:hypothetical protein
MPRPPSAGYHPLSAANDVKQQMEVSENVDGDIGGAMGAPRLRLVPVLLSVIAVLLSALLLVSVKAFAGTTQSPTFATSPVVTQAKFVIPKGSDATWTLRLWSHGQLLGVTTGTSGVLSVALPGSQSCTIQADVRTTRSSGRFRYYSGLRSVSSCCPPLATSVAGGLTTSVSSS